MEKKKNTEIQKFLLMLVLVVLMAFVGYKFLCKPLLEERDSLREENFKLNTRLIELMNKAIEADTYTEAIAKSKEQITAVLAKYSAGNTPEKSIVFVNELESEIGIEIPNVSFSMPTVLTNVQMPMVNESGAESNNNYSIAYYNVSLLGETLSMGYSCTYDELKAMVNYINEYPERMNIQSITVSYNAETSELSGSMVMNLYAVTGTDKVYEEPKVKDIRIGETNIFAQ